MWDCPAYYVPHICLLNFLTLWKGFEFKLPESLVAVILSIFSATEHKY